MEIRKATAADLEAVAHLYDEVVDNQTRNINYTNWEKGVYPARPTAEKALEAGTLYVQTENGQLVGSMILNHEQLPEYDRMNWRYPAQGEQVLVIHTLCVSPTATGQGYAGAMVRFAEDLGRKLGCITLRLDTYEGNLPARRLYTRLGYDLIGGTEFFFQGFIHEILVLFEKKL